MPLSLKHLASTAGPLFIALLLFSITACTGSSSRPAISSLPLAFSLKSPLQIPANMAHVNFQHGALSSGRNLFEPHCEFEIDTVSEQPQVISPDTFKVTHAFRRVVTDEQSGMPAFAPAVVQCGERYYERHFRLHSDRQPGVRKLVCREGFHFCDGGFMTLESIQQALGTRLVIENAADRML